LNNRLVTNGPVFISAAQLYLGPHHRERSPARGGRLHHPHRRAGSGLTIGDRNGRHGERFTWSAVVSAVYQLQSRTNLVQDNWSNLGNAITATNTIMSASDSIGPDPQRFYRLLVP